jgi:hypothetical protein
VGAAALLIGVAFWKSPWAPLATLKHVAAAPDCAVAEAVGLAPARRGQPGYWSHLDRDHDGVACPTQAQTKPQTASAKGKQTAPSKGKQTAPSKGKQTASSKEKKASK